MNNPPDDGTGTVYLTPGQPSDLSDFISFLAPDPMPAMTPSKLSRYTQKIIRSYGDDPRWRQLAITDQLQKGDQFWVPAGRKTPGRWKVVVPAWIGRTVNDCTSYRCRRRKPESPEDVTKRMLEQTKKARAKTKLGQLERLLAARTTWQRKQTIATNKLAEVDARIRDFATAMANDRLEADLNASHP